MQDESLGRGDVRVRDGSGREKMVRGREEPRMVICRFGPSYSNRGGGGGVSGWEWNGKGGPVTVLRWYGVGKRYVVFYLFIFVRIDIRVAKGTKRKVMCFLALLKWFPRSLSDSPSPSPPPFFSPYPSPVHYMHSVTYMISWIYRCDPSTLAGTHEPLRVPPLGPPPSPSSSAR